MHLRSFSLICDKFFRGQSFNSVVSEIQPRDPLLSCILKFQGNALRVYTILI
ncbi:MAG: hypothetical protein [Olavius algarvensis Gamma 1 endosymbiont]|nr:MAG: hypothetical protein [Olavius algarvensis Gamma 1 endosymbiont]